MQDKRRDDDGWRIPARELENRITTAIIEFLSDDLKLLELARSDDDHIQSMRSIRSNAVSLGQTLAKGDTHQRQTLIQRLVKQIRLSNTELTIDLNRHGLRAQLLPPETLHSMPNDEPDTITIKLPLNLRRRGVEAKMIVGLNHEIAPCVDDNLILTIAKAHAWFDALATGKAKSIQQLAETEDTDANDISRCLQLAFLTPSIVEQILSAKQPTELTSHSLKRIGDLPLCWKHQQILLDCA